MPPELFDWLKKSDGKLSGCGTDYFFVEGMNQARRVLGGLKPICNFSYDWSTNVYTIGICKDVWLESCGPARVEALGVSCRFHEGYRSADIDVSADLTATWDCSGTLHITLLREGRVAAEALEPIKLSAGEHKATVTLHLDQPELWWPVGHGSQPLYDLKAELMDNVGHAPMMRNGEFATTQPSNLESFTRYIPQSSRWPIAPEDPVMIRKNVSYTVDSDRFWLNLPMISAGNQVRIANAMRKAKRGAPVTIGIIGGSISQGAVASAANKRYVNLIQKWWKDTFPKSEVTLVNAAIGSTDSVIAVHRLDQDLLRYKPDFVIWSLPQTILRAISGQWPMKTCSAGSS